MKGKFVTRSEVHTARLWWNQDGVTPLLTKGLKLCSGKHATSSESNYIVLNETKIINSDKFQLY